MSVTAIAAGRWVLWKNATAGMPELVMLAGLPRSGQVLMQAIATGGVLLGEHEPVTQPDGLPPPGSAAPPVT